MASSAPPTNEVAMRPWPLLPFLLPLLSADARPSSAVDDFLGLAVEEVESVDGDVSDAERRRVAALVGLPDEVVAAARVDEGLLDGKAVTAVRVRLAAPFAAVRFVGVVDPRGALVTAAAEGRPDLDEDPRRTWGQFLGLFTKRGRLVPRGEFGLWLDDAVAHDEYLAHRAATEAEPEARDWDATMRAQRVFMQRNALLSRWAFDRREEVMPPVWLEEQAATARRLAAEVDRFAPTLGEVDVAAYRDALEQVGAALAAAHEAARAGEPVARIFKDRVSVTCRACHAADRDWDDRFVAAREARGYPVGMMIPGYDVAPAIGDDGALSAALAQAVRASLLLADAVLED